MLIMTGLVAGFSNPGGLASRISSEMSDRGVPRNLLVQKLRQAHCVIRSDPQLATAQFHHHTISSPQVPDAFFMCVDLWQREPNRYLSVFEFLGLAPEEPCNRYVQLCPKVNETISRQVRPTVLQEPENRAADECILATLHEARRMLLAGEMQLRIES